jgi:hypothetical protein
VQKKLKVDIRHKGPLARRSGAVTSTDAYERDERPAGRSREFRDALMRVGDSAIAGIPTHMKEWNRWRT